MARQSKLIFVREFPMFPVAIPIQFDKVPEKPNKVIISGITIKKSGGLKKISLTK